MFLSRRLVSSPLVALFLATTLAVSAQTGQPEPQETPASTESAPAPPKEAPAEVDEWKVKVIPFVWVPATDLSVSYGDRTVNRVIEPSDVVGKLQFAVAGAIAAENGPWGIMGEGLYANTADDVQFRRISGSMRSNQTILQASGSYRLVDDDGLSLDAVAGLRYFDFGFTNAFTRDGVIFTQAFETSRGKSWVDPLVGLRASIPFNEELSLNLYGDVGGFGVGSDFSWRAQAVFGYSVSDSVALNLGYAALGARNEQGVGLDYLKFKFTNYGPVLGATFKL